MKVKPKKHLGQHFLIDLDISKKIADSLTLSKGNCNIMEVGPGVKFLLPIAFLSSFNGTLDVLEVN